MSGRNPARDKYLPPTGIPLGTEMRVSGDFRDDKGFRMYPNRVGVVVGYGNPEIQLAHSVRLKFPTHKQPSRSIPVEFVKHT